MGTVSAPVDQLVSLVYVSSAVQKMQDDEILEILRLSRQKNERQEVTGMLLYRDGNFMQLLEGPAGAVDALIATIKRDPRHHGLILMSRQAIGERLFAGWSMAFRNMSQTPIPGYSSFLETDTLHEETGEQSQLVYRLLRSFRTHIR
jgi:hypothetical protein